MARDINVSTSGELAAALGLSTSDLLKLVAEGKVPALNASPPGAPKGKWLFHRPTCMATLLGKAPAARRICFDGDVVTSAELAVRWGVHQETVRKLAINDRVPSLNTGGKLLFYYPACIAALMQDDLAFAGDCCFSEIVGAEQLAARWRINVRLVRRLAERGDLSAFRVHPGRWIFHYPSCVAILANTVLPLQAARAAESDIVNVDELAERWGISARTVYRLLAAGAIPSSAVLDEGGVEQILLHYQTCLDVLTSGASNRATSEAE